MIEVEFAIPFAPREAWDLLTDPSHVEKWWGDHVLLDRLVGGKFSEDWTDNDGMPRHTEGVVTALEDAKRLQLNWQDDGWKNPTRVEFMLSQNEQGSRIYLQHSGWENFESEDDRQKYVDEYREGWHALMKKFQEYAAAQAK